MPLGKVAPKLPGLSNAGTVANIKSTGPVWALYTPNVSVSNNLPSTSSATSTLTLSYGLGTTANTNSSSGTKGAIHVGSGITSSGTSDRNIIFWSGAAGSAASTQTLTVTNVVDSVILIPGLGVGSGGAQTAYSQSVVIGGQTNNQSAVSICIGYSANTSTSQSSPIAIGDGASCPTASTNLPIALGTAAQAGASYSIAIGYLSTVYSGNDNAISIGSRSTSDFMGEINICNAQFANYTDIATANFPIYYQTANATPVELGTSAGTATLTPAHYIALTNNSTYMFNIDVIARKSAAGTDYASWNLMFSITREAAAANTAITGNVIKNVIAMTSGAAAWDVNVTADTTNGRPAIKVTGQSSTTIRWVANVRMTKAMG